jgi:pyruvate/2-oxoglutarate dehydrogenase complex dihydrolipoamide acyltransferase (E2) component
MVEVTLPKFGHLMEEATICELVKKVGAQVKKGEIILSVETDKAVMDVEAPENGVLKEILVAPGDVVKVGAIIAVIE